MTLKVNFDQNLICPFTIPITWSTCASFIKVSLGNSKLSSGSLNTVKFSYYKQWRLMTGFSWGTKFMPAKFIMLFPLFFKEFFIF